MLVTTLGRGTDVLCREPIASRALASLHSPLGPVVMMPATRLKLSSRLIATRGHVGQLHARRTPLTEILLRSAWKSRARYQGAHTNNPSRYVNVVAQVKSKDGGSKGPKPLQNIVRRVAKPPKMKKLASTKAVARVASIGAITPGTTKDLFKDRTLEANMGRTDFMAFAAAILVVGIFGTTLLHRSITEPGAISSEVLYMKGPDNFIKFLSTLYLSLVLLAFPLVTGTLDPVEMIRRLKSKSTTTPGGRKKTK